MWIGDVCVCLCEHYIATSMKLKLFEDINKPNLALKDNLSSIRSQRECFHLQYSGTSFSYQDVWLTMKKHDGNSILGENQIVKPEILKNDEEIFPIEVEISTYYK